MPARTHTETSLMRDDGEFMLTYVSQLIAGAAAYGIYAAVFAFAVSALAQRRERTRAWLFILIISIVLFIMSTIQLVHPFFKFVYQTYKLNLAEDYRPLNERKASIGSLSVVTTCVANGIFLAEFLIGDAIVVWRTWVLWSGSRWVYGPMIFWLIAFASMVAERVFCLKSGQYSGFLQNSEASGLTKGLQKVGFAMSVSTNAVSTFMIAYRAWRYRQAIKRNLGRTTTSRVERVLSLLIESGTIYLCFWTVSIVTTYSHEFGPLSLFSHVWTVLGMQVLGLYPTSVIAIIELQRSLLDDISTASISLSTLPASVLPASVAGEAEAGRDVWVQLPQLESGEAKDKEEFNPFCDPGGE